MPVLIYDGSGYHLSAKDAGEVKETIKEATNGGVSLWLDMPDDDGGKVSILISPCIPMAIREGAAYEIEDSIL